MSLDQKVTFAAVSLTKSEMTNYLACRTICEFLQFKRIPSWEQLLRKKTATNTATARVRKKAIIDLSLRLCEEFAEPFLSFFFCLGSDCAARLLFKDLSETSVMGRFFSFPFLFVFLLAVVCSSSFFLSSLPLENTIDISIIPSSLLHSSSSPPSSTNLLLLVLLCLLCFSAMRFSLMFLGKRFRFQKRTIRNKRATMHGRVVLRNVLLLCFEFIAQMITASLRLDTSGCERTAHKGEGRGSLRNATL